MNKGYPSHDSHLNPPGHSGLKQLFTPKLILLGSYYMCTNETAFKLFTVQPIIEHVFRFANQAHKLFQLAKSIKGKYKDTFIYLSIYYFFFFFEYLYVYYFKTTD